MQNIPNFYSTIKRGKPSINPNVDIHGIEVPFRMVIASGSGTGKTHALCRLIHAFGKTFHEIIVCVQTADEPLYEMIDNRLNAEQRHVYFYEQGVIPDITEFSIKDAAGRLKRKDDLQRLIVFDDLMMNRQANAMIAEYYLRGRKLGFSCVYISQSFFQVPKVVRLNTQYFILGKNIQKRDIRTILSLFSVDLSLDEFTRLYNELTEQALDTMTLDVIKKTIRHNIVGRLIQL